MVNLDYLSDNLTIILGDIINNQNIVKYISYDVSNPLSQADLLLPASDLILNRVYPFPCDPVALVNDSTEIRVYYPKCDFQADSVLGSVEVYIDIVVAKTLWLINNGVKSQVRPYMIIKEIMKQFNNVSSGTVGQLHFDGFVHVNVNTKFDAIRLITTMELFGE